MAVLASFDPAPRTYRPTAESTSQALSFESKCCFGRSVRREIEEHVRCFIHIRTKRRHLFEIWLAGHALGMRAGEAMPGTIPKPLLRLMRQRPYKPLRFVANSGTRCCTIVFPLSIGAAGAFQEPREVLHTHQNTAHGGPCTRRASARRALGPPCAVLSCRSRFLSCCHSNCP